MERIRERVHARVRCINRNTMLFFDRDFWVDLASLSQIDEARIRLLQNKFVPSNCFVHVRSLFNEGAWPIEPRCQFSTLPFSDNYFEDENGNQLSEIDLARIFSGSTHPIIAGNFESVLKLGQSQLLRSELWTANTSNTIAHFLQLVEVIGSGDWLKSNLSISSPSSSNGINSFECPELGTMYAVLLPLRQLYAMDKAFDHACNMYLRHVGDTQKLSWIKDLKCRFHTFLDSSPNGAFYFVNHSVSKLIDVVLYGAGLVHFNESSAEHKLLFNELMTNHPQEMVIFDFVMCCRQIYGYATEAYSVIRQDYDHWISSGQVAKPDLKFMRGLFLSRPESSKRSNYGAFRNGTPAGSMSLTRIFAIHRADGLIDLTHDFPDDDKQHAVPIELLGPVRVTLPIGPITQDEFNKWEREWTFEKGYSQLFSSRSLSSPSFEWLRLGPFVSDVSLNMNMAWWGSSNGRRLVISVTNTCKLEIPQIHAVWSWNPQSDSDIRDTKLHARSGRFQLHCADSKFNSTLYPGQSVLFYADTEHLSVIHQHVVAYSPQMYTLSICSVDQEIVNFDNVRVAQFLVS